MWSEFILILVRKFFLSRTKTKKISRRILKFLEPQSCHVRFEKKRELFFRFSLF
ncbi:MULTISPECIES: DUF1661 domain-containing protein [Porphyromonas]|uniref:DUF1661 domain-containing protein n=1 Tax=Porphyromonas TaxID=836 RepID=UPI000ABB7468|nr:DUF1661 domain-containing protein [Porphyromonas gingivalis]MCE8182317.1 DUF1661 domain-containing protein [Porphyromonas gingivalis]MDP0531566.1 DUF1661 domain-containing protein [Porphyromonas gingivalis]USI93339.1 DUF1661 domain-containing protein [Porphyromonas gingivalis]WCG00608.1 DUF1661 domain-containing protein [Porphyromonas gingivalis]WKD52276.1 DUF1661 domain-containing protein [Porphyromonas gingivalis]